MVCKHVKSDRIVSLLHFAPLATIARTNKITQCPSSKTDICRWICRSEGTFAIV